jgi:hypothetical protein
MGRNGQSLTLLVMRTCHVRSPSSSSRSKTRQKQSESSPPSPTVLQTGNVSESGQNFINRAKFQRQVKFPQPGKILETGQNIINRAKLGKVSVSGQNFRNRAKFAALGKVSETGQNLQRYVKFQSPPVLLHEIVQNSYYVESLVVL